MPTLPGVADWIAAILFACAVLHTFSVRHFERLARAHPAHAGLLHLLAEVEVVFGVWALVLVLVLAGLAGRHAAVTYLESRDFTEPMFVFAIMVVAGSRPVLRLAGGAVRTLGGWLPLPRPVATYLLTLTLVPLFGSAITEPAAMTVAALLLRDRFCVAGVSTRFLYGTLAVLFVNVSIGGTLSAFAAPPVLMVADTWGWDSAFMLRTFGWKASLAVAINAVGAALVFRAELREAGAIEPAPGPAVPVALLLAHLAFLGGIVVFAHHPPVFLGLLLFFIGFARAYETHQDRLMLREGLLVAFFLAGLVVLGGLQRWWLEPLVMSMSADQVFFGALALTAVTDNAALTYLGSLVPGLSAEFRHALVAGAVAGGGLTLIANAPNPAGFAILKERFPHATLQPLRFALAAAMPTAVGAAALRIF